MQKDQAGHIALVLVLTFLFVIVALGTGLFLLKIWDAKQNPNSLDAPITEYGPGNSLSDEKQLLPEEMPSAWPINEELPAKINVPPSSNIPVAAKFYPLILSQKNKLIRLYEDGSVRQVVETPNERIISHSYDTNMHYLTYATTTDTVSLPTATLKIDNAYIYTLKNGQVRKIYTLTQESTIADCLNTLDSVQISPNGRFVALTTQKELRLYETESGNLISTYPLPQQNMLCSYNIHSFSPDTKKILLLKGFWEGLGAVIVELNTGQITDSQFFAYMGGPVARGWSNNDGLYYTKSTSLESGISSRTTFHKTIISQLPLLAENRLNGLSEPNPIGDGLKGWVMKSSALGNSLIYTANEEKEDNSATRKLKKLNLETGNITNLLEDNELFQLDGSFYILSENALYFAARTNNNDSASDLYLLENGEVKVVPNISEFEFADYGYGY